MKNKNLLVVIIFFVVIFNSIVYSALNSEMFINGDAHIRVDKDIRITSVKVLEQVNGAYETYNSDYSKNTTSMQVTLPSSKSIMIYEIIITNKGDTDYEVTNILEESYSNSNIKYELIDIEKGKIIDGGTTHTFKIKFTTTENNSDNKTTLVLKYTFEEWVPSLYKMVAHKSRDLDTDIDFGVSPTKETSGVYKMDSTKNDEYPVYYYRGIIDNNNVNFAGFCWKIVRTTETGGVKLIYNGVPGSDGSCNNTGDASSIGTSQFNSNSTSINDVSYIYDDGNDSSIKKVIDKWYLDNMTNYTEMLEDTVWCNDRSVSKYSTTYTFFVSRIRLIEKPYEPKITCQNDNYKFSVDEINGNGKLSYPIALLTGDELTLAGSGYVGYNPASYLCTGKTWWTISPHFFESSIPVSDVIIMTNSNNLSGRYVSLTADVRPAISLVRGTMIKEGNGSVSNPYKLVDEKIQREYTFDYTGGEQEFKVPYDGVYKLEVWGGGPSLGGGAGGYSSGNVNLSIGQNLYIVVGEGPVNATGGYNGGGNGNGAPNFWVTGGGGATHISTTNRGVLQNYENFKDEILIVAAGGGGGTRGSGNGSAYGGAGGGLVGINGGGQYYGSGATQTTGGVKAYGSATDNAGSFGKGSDADPLYDVNYTRYYAGGGGGGYYGGSGGSWSAYPDSAGGGGGGSSFIDNVINGTTIAGNDTMPSHDGSSTMIGNSGHGYAKITFVGKN